MAWKAGKPHAALEIIVAGGYADEWRTFQKVALRLARERFNRSMSRYAR